MSWYYEGKLWKPSEDDLKEYEGFVYEITDLVSKRKYIGKKGFWFNRSRPPLKGRKNKRRYKVESDWRDYYGSSQDLLQRLKDQGRGKFKREILHLCYGKGEMSYLEAKEQLMREVLLSDDYYTGIINCRIGEKSVERLRNEH